MIILVLGGTRSGKSEVAESLVGEGPATYLATGVAAPGDSDFAARIDRHRTRRPATWSTVEEGRAVPGLLARLHGPVLVDSLGTWVANDLRPDIDGLVAALRSRPGDTVVVSEEVGLGVHPATALGRQFADVLGEVNRSVAAVADRTLFVVAGRVVELPGGPRRAPPGAEAGSARSPRPGTPDAHPPELAPGGPPGAAPGGAPGNPPGRAPGNPPGRAPGNPPGKAAEALANRARSPEGSGFAAALSLLTPFGRATTPGPRAVAWLPLVGALVGLALGLAWSATDGLLGPVAAAAVVVALDLAATGALHFDGLVDTADGLLPHLRSARRLEVMAEPGVGAFGVAVGVTALLLRLAALTTLAASGGARPLLLAGLWAGSRTVMALTLTRGRPARPEGFAAMVAGGGGIVTGALAATGALALAAFDDPWSPLALVAGAVAGHGVARLARRRVGGFTGDTLGASGVVAETVGLLVAVAVTT